MDWFESLIEWIKTLWHDFTEFMLDLPIEILDLILKGISTVIKAIPVPDFAVDGLQTVVNNFPDSVLWMMSVTNIPAALAVVGAGVLFRLTRKLVTLGQW